MANKLKMAMINAIIGLLEQGWSYRRIERELGVRRETVSRYDRLRQSDSNPAKVSPGSLNVSRACRSECQPFTDIITLKLDQGLSAKRIWQDLKAEHGYPGGYSSVKRFVRKLGSRIPLPFRRMECEPGQEAQVDLGSGAWVIDNGKKRRPHVLRVKLSHSRKSYSEAIWRQTTESFLSCLENAFRSFGGSPKTLVTDNLKAAVDRADWFDPDLNPKIVEFCRHYGVVLLPTKPRMPRHKGKIESGIKYVKNNALKGRTFSSLAEQNLLLADWEKNVADTRIHGTTKRQVRQVYEEVERPTLQPLPAQPFPFYHEGRRKVSRDAHVEVAKAYYSVPPEYLGHQVWVRWDSRLVRIFNDQFCQIAIHARVEPGRFNTNRHHLADAKISGVERGAEYLLSRANRIGDDAARWARAMLDHRGIEGVRVLQGFLSLASRNPADAINHASSVALRSNCFRLRQLKELIKRTLPQSEFDFCQQHEIIRPLSEYQQMLKVSFNPETSRKEQP